MYSLLFLVLKGIFHFHSSGCLALEYQIHQNHIQMDIYQIVSVFMHITKQYIEILSQTVLLFTKEKCRVIDVLQFSLRNCLYLEGVLY